MIKEIVTPQTVEQVRSRIRGSLEHPVNGKIILGIIVRDLQAMIGWRVQRKAGGFYPENPDDFAPDRTVHGQRACEIYQGKVILATDIWEDHKDIRARGKISETEFHVSGEQFYMRNLPKVPVIRCDATPHDEDMLKLRQNYILMDPFYKVLFYKVL